MDLWMDGWADGLVSGWIDRTQEGLIDRCIDRWMDDWWVNQLEISSKLSVFTGGNSTSGTDSEFSSIKG